MEVSQEAARCLSRSIPLHDLNGEAGIIGAGGLGNLAFLDGFQRNRQDVTLMATILILVVVFIIQWIGDLITEKIDKR